MTTLSAGQDWVGLWFAIAREERGIDDLFTVLRLDTRQQKVLEFHDIHHAQMDGVGALGWLLHQKGHAQLRLPLGRSRRPRALPALRMMKRLLNDSSQRRIDWAVRGSSRPAPLHEIAWTVLTHEETSALETRAKAQGVTLNALMLSTLSNLISVDTVRGDKPFFWVFPVNMRGAVNLSNPYANHVSALAVECHKGITSQAVHERIRASLKQQLHWGIWWASNVGRLIGERGVRRLARKSPDRNVWMGTFSNLGRWDTAPGEAPSDDAWTFSPMGSATFPVNFGCAIWNGRLAMTLKIHPSLINEFSETQRYLDLLRQHLLACPAERRPL